MRHFVSALFALAISLPAFAADLTDKSVQQWVQSYAKVIEWSKTQDQKELDFLEEQQSNRNPEFGNLFSNALKDMKEHKLYGGLRNVLKQSGYSDPAEWAEQGDRIMAATLAVEMDNQKTNSAQTRAQMKQAMDALMANPNMTAEQKAQMQQMMGMGSQMMDVADNVPAADKAVVKRNLEMIKTVMEEQAEEQADE
ncbi:MAG: hypothetical protein R3F47_19035 [Gammaproteobacteria bacterium]